MKLNFHQNFIVANLQQKFVRIYRNNKVIYIFIKQVNIYL